MTLAACGLLLVGLTWASPRLNGGEIVYQPTKLGTAVFRHDWHLSQKDVTCASCHNSVFAGHDRRVKGKMKDLQAGKLCGSCHDGKKAFSSKQKCGRCHKARPADDGRVGSGR